MVAGSLATLTLNVAIGCFRGGLTGFQIRIYPHEIYCCHLPGTNMVGCVYGYVLSNGYNMKLNIILEEDFNQFQLVHHCEYHVHDYRYICSEIPCGWHLLAQRYHTYPPGNHVSVKSSIEWPDY